MRNKCIYLSSELELLYHKLEEYSNRANVNNGHWPRKHRAPALILFIKDGGRDGLKTPPEPLSMGPLGVCAE